MENYNVDYFIKKFEAIPEDKWCTHKQADGEGRHCALGWVNKNNRSNNGKEHEALWNLFLQNDIYGTSMSFAGVARVNNGLHPKYQQPTPKQRILAALYDIKKLQQPEYPDITKELATFEIGDKTDLPIKKPVIDKGSINV